MHVLPVIGYTGNGDSYEPIKWSIGQKSNLTFAELQSEIKDINTSNASINPGESIEGDSLTISWKWDFNENNEELSKKDTLLGVMAAAGTSETTWEDVDQNLYNIDLIMDVNVEVTISQLQKTN